MKFLKTKLAVLLATSCLMVPSVISAATETDAPYYTYQNGVVHTLVHGVLVPGRYTNVDEDTVAVYIPGGVGIIAVDKDAVLPWGSKVLE
ncbi:hypothetical protein [Paenibacillus sp. Soil750]|uniref:hypothetical protein n=1 Tax=Paenibacillus sp. Soil750 TaxID=1736398 RepID=UPI0007014EE6|nr:hypothetical protein [Paenibacillus sp. Soil750]KRE68911.1 hypothetical protein ASL11_17625 [Paenibacillus sp. Soil750]